MKCHAWTCKYARSSARTENNGLDKRDHRAQCGVKLFLAAECDPDSANREGGNSREGGGRKGWDRGEYKWDRSKGKVLGGCGVADAECMSTCECVLESSEESGSCEIAGRQCEVGDDWRWTAERSRHVPWEGADVRHRQPWDDKILNESVAGRKDFKERLFKARGGTVRTGEKEKAADHKKVQWLRQRKT